MASACSVAVATDTKTIGSADFLRTPAASTCVLVTISIVCICFLVVCGVLVVREYSLAAAYESTRCRLKNVTYAPRDVHCVFCTGMKDKGASKEKGGGGCVQSQFPCIRLMVTYVGQDGVPSPDAILYPDSLQATGQYSQCSFSVCLKTKEDNHRAVEAQAADVRRRAETEPDSAGFPCFYHADQRDSVIIAKLYSQWDVLHAMLWPSLIILACGAVFLRLEMRRRHLTCCGRGRRRGSCGNGSAAPGGHGGGGGEEGAGGGGETGKKYDEATGARTKLSHAREGSGEGWSGGGGGSSGQLSGGRGGEGGSGGGDGRSRLPPPPPYESYSGGDGGSRPDGLQGSGQKLPLLHHPHHHQQPQQQQQQAINSQYHQQHHHHHHYQPSCEQQEYSPPRRPGERGGAVGRGVLEEPPRWRKDNHVKQPLKGSQGAAAASGRGRGAEDRKRAPGGGVGGALSGIAKSGGRGDGGRSIVYTSLPSLDAKDSEPDVEMTLLEEHEQEQLPEVTSRRFAGFDVSKRRAILKDKTCASVDGLLANGS